MSWSWLLDRGRVEGAAEVVDNEGPGVEHSYHWIMRGCRNEQIAEGCGG